jgi:4-amino-4-deoxy-L-arabinose transferase-like glycosyltransferase
MGKRSREKRSRRTATPPPPRTAAPEALAYHPPRSGLEGEGAAPTTSRAHWTAVLVLLGLSLLVRGLLVVQIGRTPYIEIGNIDSTAYQQWATRIAGGEWLPTGTFYQSPFYAYFLAVLYKIFGTGPWSPRVVQVMLGSLSPVLLYAIGTRLFSRRVGWIAGIGLALYGPIILEEITFSKTTLLVVTALAGFAFYLQAAERGRMGAMLGAGVLFGVSVVGVGQWLLPFLGLIAWAPRMGGSLPWPRRRLLAVAFAAGGLAVIVPLVVWNSARGGGLVLTSADAGLNFYNGNNERSSGLPAAPLGVRDVPQYEESDARQVAEQAVGHPLSPAAVSRYWSGQGLAWIAQHPGGWVVLVARKLATMWNGFEIPDNYEYAFMEAHFLPLRPLVTFSLVAPLALVGAAMPFWRRRDLTALYIACFGYLVTMLIFYVRGRYRIPAVPFLIVFAAVAVDRAWKAIEARQWSTVGILAGGIAVAGVFTNHEYCEGPHNGMNAVCLGGDTWFDQEWLKLAEWSRNNDQLDRAIAYAERARECTRPRSPGQIASWIGDLRMMRIEQLMREGRRDEAMVHFTSAEATFRTALRLGIRPAVMNSRLGTLYAMVGKPAEAVAAFEAAGDIDPAAARRFARAYVDLGRCADGERVLTKLDRDRGLDGPSDETRAILSACASGN